MKEIIEHLQLLNYALNSRIMENEKRNRYGNVPYELENEEGNNDKIYKRINWQYFVLNNTRTIIKKI